MISPENVSTDYYADKATDEYAALGVVEAVGAGALGAAAFNYEGFEAAGLLVLSVGAGALAVHSIYRAIAYAKRSGEIGPR